MGWQRISRYEPKKMALGCEPTPHFIQLGKSFQMVIVTPVKPLIWIIMMHCTVIVHYTMCNPNGILIIIASSPYVCFLLGQASSGPERKGWWSMQQATFFSPLHSLHCIALHCMEPNINMLYNCQVAFLHEGEFSVLLCMAEVWSDLND